MSNEIRVLLSALDPHRRDLCAAVLALCAPEFEAPAPPTQVFLSSLYQKLCGRMFPDGLPEIPALTADEEGYLAALESALQNPADSFDPCLDLLPLPEDSIPGSRVEGQYRLFTDTVRQDHLMAVMRLGMEETPFDPASHTIGVHNVALHTAILAARACGGAGARHRQVRLPRRGPRAHRLSALLLYLAVVQPEPDGGDRLHLRQPLDLGSGI